MILHLNPGNQKSLYPWDMRLSGPQTRYGRGGDDDSYEEV